MVSRLPATTVWNCREFPNDGDKTGLCNLGLLFKIDAGGNPRRIYHFIRASLKHSWP